MYYVIVTSSLMYSLKSIWIKGLTLLQPVIIVALTKHLLCHPSPLVQNYFAAQIPEKIKATF